MEGTGIDSAGVLERARTALEGRSALVVGLGRTGVAACRFLSAAGAAVTATDVRPSAEIPEAAGLEASGVVIKAGGHGEADFGAADLVVVSPGVPCLSPDLEEARRSGAEVIGEVELAFRFIDAPVVAVAGTNGKSTVTELLGRIFTEAGVKAFVGGNLGTPVVEYLSSGGGADVCVLEVSSFQLETIETFAPRVAVLLNITEDHLDRYSGFDEYARTKKRLFENMTEDGTAVVNAADPTIAGWLAGGLGRMRTVTFSTEEGAATEIRLIDGSIVCSPSGGPLEEYPAGLLRLKGLHNIENVMAAIGAARAMGAGPEAVRSALASFEGLPHRMELVREHHGVTYIDDSKGTNIGSLMMALRGMTSPVILIAGGRDKGGDYSVLSGLIKEKVKLLILIGEAKERMKKALGDLTMCVDVPTLEDAVNIAYAGGRDGDVVLLCPACSSFDMFRDYRERGEAFKRLVMGL